MQELQRNQQALIHELLDQFPVVALIGARQVGKTTLAKQIKPNWRYVDLENPNDYEQIARDPILFFNQYESHIIIDEAQSYPELFRVLRGVIDKQRDSKGRFILTGSSSPELTRQISETLAGRIAVVEIGTLKANEYYQKPLSEFYQLFIEKLDIKNLVTGRPPLTREEMNFLWLKGGYPEPLLENSSDFWQRWMENYCLNYINRDVAKLFPRMNKIKYQSFIRVLAALSSTILNKSDLARGLEINEGSVREYLRIAEGTFLWRELASFEKSKLKSTIKMPKGYLRDSGLLFFLLNVRTLDELYVQPKIGNAFEGFVIEEIIKGISSLGITNWRANYFRTRKGSEIDLILEGYFGILPIEIKYSSTIDNKKLRHLSEFIEMHSLPFGIVINQADTVTWLTEKIIQIPVGWL